MLGRHAEGNDAFLGTLAGDPHGESVQIDVGDVEANELRDPQPRRIEQFHYREVAQRRRVGTGGTKFQVGE